MSYHLAQINIGRLIAPMDDPRIAEFVAQLAPINALADASPGFVWRLQSAQGNAMEIAYDGDPSMNVNMSVWESLDALKRFTYQSQHVQLFRERRKWFEKTDTPYQCLWWIRAGHIPTVVDGRARLEHFRVHGSTAHAFSFSEPHPAPSESELE